MWEEKATGYKMLDQLGTLHKLLGCTPSPGDQKIAGRASWATEHRCATARPHFLCGLANEIPGP